VIEERNSSDATTEQYTWSPVYVDSMVARDRDADEDDQTGTVACSPQLMPSDMRVF
jgi:hypothetical protein